MKASTVLIHTDKMSSIRGLDGDRSDAIVSLLGLNRKSRRCQLSEGRVSRVREELRYQCGVDELEDFVLTKGL